MNKTNSLPPTRAPLPTAGAAGKRNRRIGAKTLITLSSLAITLAGWAYLSVAASAEAAQAQVTAQQDVSTSALPQSQPSPALDPLPTIAPLANLGANASNQAVAIPAAPQPTNNTQAPLPKPRKIHIRATTRSSR